MGAPTCMRSMFCHEAERCLNVLGRLAQGSEKKVPAVACLMAES